MDPIGRKRWAIAEGYIPSQSSFSDRTLISHETACILNAGDTEAHVTITIFFANREAVGPYRVTVDPRAHAAPALQRSLRPARDTARHRLRVGVRVGRSDHRAAYAHGYAARRNRAFVDNCVFRRLMIVNVMIALIHVNAI